ncbi:hypothetical protein RQP46_009613 [Phenoliferia psychrophenolica]
MSDASSEPDLDDPIPNDERASMEEEYRELPEGWVRQYSQNHAFYVDTAANPPRSIWTHPYDDIEYLRSLPESSEVRQHYIAEFHEAQKQEKGNTKVSEDRKGSDPRLYAPSASSGGNAAAGSSSAGASDEKKDDRSMGRKIKDKMTGTNHDQRVRARREQKEQELKQYQQFVMRREQLIQAQRNNPHNYAPPMQGYPGASRGYRAGGGYGYGGGGYGGRRGMGPMGYGAMGMGGGLMGGLLIGDMMGGGFGGGGFGGGGFDGGMGGGGGMGC